MIANTDIQQGAVTATKLSKNLRLPLKNITAGESGQVLVGQANGDPAYKSMSGAVTIDSDGVTEVSATTDTVTEGPTNLYYTDERVDARIRTLRGDKYHLATNLESGFMHSNDKGKLDTMPPAASSVRKYTTIITGDGSETVFTVNHGLGTQNLIVGVRMPVGSGGGTLADKFTNESYVQMDVGYDASSPGVMVGHFDSSGNLSDHHVTLQFAGTPGNGDEYLVTIIG